MQIPNAAPRDSLTAAQVFALLTGPAVSISAGLELLSPNLAVTADISDDLLGGTVSRAMVATVHGTCQLEISRALSWGTDLIRPYMVVSSGSTSARFNLGVFTIATPELIVAETPQTYTCHGLDRLYLLQREVGDTYAVAAGTGYLAAVRTAITNAGLSGVLLDGTANAKTLPQPMAWPLWRQSRSADVTASNVGQSTAGGASTWLDVINDLLSTIGYRNIYADQDGVFRSEPYANPKQRAVEFTFDTGAATIIGEQRTYVLDTWTIPNRWLFIQMNRGAGDTVPTAGDGLYTVDNVSNGITSQNSRGLIWPKTVRLNAADQASLMAQGDVIVAADQRRAANLKVTTGPWPLAGHVDVYQFQDSVLGSLKVQATSWSMNLDGSDVQWTWDAIT